MVNANKICVESLRSLLLAACLFFWCEGALLADDVSTTVIAGMDGSTPVNAPSYWSTEESGHDWNAKGARYNDYTNRIAFESFRDTEEFQGGSFWRAEVSDMEDDSFSSNYVASWVFRADYSTDPENPLTLPRDIVDSELGLGTGVDTAGVEGSNVVYIANYDGSNPVCLGCETIVSDATGVDAYYILEVGPSASGTANTVSRINETIRTNQNKDMPS